MNIYAEIVLIKREKRMNNFGKEILVRLVVIDSKVDEFISVLNGAKNEINEMGKMNGEYKNLFGLNYYDFSKWNMNKKKELGGI